MDRWDRETAPRLRGVAAERRGNNNSLSVTARAFARGDGAGVALSRPVAIVDGVVAARTRSWRCRYAPWFWAWEVPCSALSSRVFIYFGIVLWSQDDALMQVWFLTFSFVLFVYISLNFVSRDLNVVVCAIVSYIIILLKHRCNPVCLSNWCKKQTNT